MAFPGVRQAMNAIAGGAGTEQDAYNAEGRRLTAARSASALMDERVAKASMAGRKDTNQASLESNLDMEDIVNQAIMGGVATQFGAGQTARGTMQENELQADLIKQFQTNPESVTPELTNIINSIIGKGSNLSAQHVNPTIDSKLDQERESAVINATDALTDQRKGNTVDPSKKRTVATTARLQEFIKPEELGAYAQWKQDNPDLLDENVALERFRSLVDSGLLDPTSGQLIDVMGGVEFDPNVVTGTENLTPAERKELRAYMDSQQVK